MRLLAVDESSTATGLAFFDGSDRPTWTRPLRPPAAWPWRRRMRWIAAELRLVLEAQGLALEPPDVIVIEDAIVARKGNPAIAISMGECRGWLMAHFDAIWPDVRILSVSPMKVRAAVGISAFAGRTHSKNRYRVVAEYLGLPSTATEDECDAAAVGLAGMAKLRQERWQAMAGSSASVSG